jgi:two-component system, OmpR family, phosphate regulon sensor histidine kinase PhoR
MSSYFSRRVLVRTLVCCLLGLVPFPELENQIFDLKMRVRGNHHLAQVKDIVIVEINKDDFDEMKKTFDKFGAERLQKNHGTWFEKFEALRDQFFWNDAVTYSILDKLLSQDPHFVLVGLFYSESVVHLQNQPELQRLARDPRVLWGSSFDVDKKFSKPAAELTGSENYGFINLQTDSDNTVRRAYLVDNSHASLPFRALLEKPDSLQWSAPLTESFLVNYAGRAGTIPTCRVTELFFANTNPSCQNLKDKYVILAPVGNAIAGVNTFSTPIGPMSRAEILANILLTAKYQTALIPVSNYFLIVVIFLHVLLLGNAILYRTALYQFVLIFNLLFSEGLLATLSLAWFRLQFPLLPFVFSTLACYIVFVWLKFADQEQLRWQALNRAQYLKELDEYKSNFISLMSHDLKTPIAKVQALTERLAREALSLSDEQKLILKGIQKSNDELAKYILGILNFQKIESQAVTLVRKSHDINILIDEVLDRLETLAQDKGVVLQKNLEPMFLLEFDEQLIKQVLNNLVENAIKYNSSGTQVIVTSEDLGDFIKISVKDNGSGIGAEDQARLFQKFSRQEKLTAERVKGTGLGLYLCKYFIELHGGRIEYESKENIGTEFRFFLPVEVTK